MNKTIATAIMCMAMSACSTMSDKVIQRSDDLSSRPDWASETVAYFEEGNKTYFVGNMVVDGGASPAWLCLAASNVTKKDVADQIQQKLDYIIQASNEDIEFGLGQLKYVGTEASNLTVSSLRREGCYWEKVLTQVDESSKGIVYRAFAKMSIPTADLKKAIKNAASKKGLSKDFQKQVDERWNVVTAFEREPNAE